MNYKDQLDTPALIVREDILRKNVNEMAEYAASKGIVLRPHFKTHKTAEVSRMQREAGSTGVTCAKLGEAEVLAETGIFDSIFIANQIVGPLKTARLVALMDQVDVSVAVDSQACAHGLQDAMADAGKSLDVILEVNTGQARAGLLPEEILPLAETIRSTMPNLRVIGLMTHEGHAGSSQTAEELHASSLDTGQKIVDTAEMLRDHGFDISVVSVGSTPAAHETTQVEGITEMRPGTYVFQDNTIFRFGELGPENCALRIVATVTSRPAPDRAVLDAGSKALTSDGSLWRAGHGYIVEYPEAVITKLNEEHAYVELPATTEGLEIGEKVQIIPNHVCPTVNLTDQLYLIRDDQVVETWPVIARGMVT